MRLIREAPKARTPVHAKGASGLGRVDANRRLEAAVHGSWASADALDIAHKLDPIEGTA